MFDPVPEAGAVHGLIEVHSMIVRRLDSVRFAGIHGDRGFRIRDGFKNKSDDLKS